MSSNVVEYFKDFPVHGEILTETDLTFLPRNFDLEKVMSSMKSNEKMKESESTC